MLRASRRFAPRSPIRGFLSPRLPATDNSPVRIAGSVTFAPGDWIEIDFPKDERGRPSLIDSVRFWGFPQGCEVEFSVRTRAGQPYVPFQRATGMNYDRYRGIALVQPYFCAVAADRLPRPPADADVGHLRVLTIRSAPGRDQEPLLVRDDPERRRDGPRYATLRCGRTVWALARADRRVALSERRCTPAAPSKAVYFSIQARSC